MVKENHIYKLGVSNTRTNLRQSQSTALYRRIKQTVSRESTEYVQISEQFSSTVYQGRSQTFDRGRGQRGGNRKFFNFEKNLRKH